MPTVTPLCSGSIGMDRSVLITGGAGEEIVAPVIVYLIEGPRTVLVDTGFGDLEQMNDRHPGFTCRRPADQELSAVLAGEGYEPADIDNVVLSHLHWDHCYNLDLFSDAEIHVPRRELEYAIAPQPMHAAGYDAKSLGYEPPWLRTEMTPMEGETTICDGVTTFPTPGHTIGHMSVAVETQAGTTVAAADAVPTFDNLSGSVNSPYLLGTTVNDFEAWESIRTVDQRGDRILPGHDWDILDTDPP